MHHPSMMSSNALLLYLSIMYMDKYVKRVFTPQPMVSFCSLGNLNKYFLWIKICTLERAVSSNQCKNKRLQVYKNIMEDDSFTFSNEQIKCKINHRLDYNKRCFIYMITCNRCLK